MTQATVMNPQDQNQETLPADTTQLQSAPVASVQPAPAVTAQPSPVAPVQPASTPQVAQVHSRNKAIAIILAALFGCFAWLYTYRYSSDKKKFWINLLILIIAGWLIGPIWLLVPWAWPLIDAIRNPEEYYTQYPNYKRVGGPLGVNSVPAAQATQPASVAGSNETFQTLIPTQNKPALWSYYFGCLGILPLVGIPFSILAIVKGREGLRLYNANPTPGAKAHANIGIWAGVIELSFFVLVIILFIIAGTPK